MNNFKSLLLPFMVIIFIGLFAGMVNLSAEDPGEKIESPIAGINIGANGIDWMPRVSYHQLMLTVSGPNGVVFIKTFQTDTSPSLEISGNNGNYLIDGSYTYELRVIPNPPKKSRESGEAAGANAGEAPLQKTLTQTGYFLVRNGRFVTPAAPETGIATPMDIVHSDDVIIDGSLCVGNDCYSGLDFGFDTIVLMENNLRIFFDDTSTIQNYPRNDWRIICNDSADGGGNYFAVEDATDISNIFVLEAGAPSNSLYVDSHGDVGINTSTPYYELHIVDGDSPAIRLDQDGSYGWTPQKWDLCGNESNFFIRDATHASKLPFRIEPDAPTNSIFIKSNGQIGIGTGAPGATLDIETTGSNASVVFERTDGAMGKFTARPSEVYIGSGSDDPVRIVGNNNKVITVEPGGDVGIGVDDPSYKLHISGGAYCDGGAWVPGSSREYKENIAALTLEEAADALGKLSPVKFNYKANPKEDYIGFIAEDVPELVATNERKGVSPMDVVAVLTKVLQEHERTIAELKEKIAELEKK